MPEPAPAEAGSPDEWVIVEEEVIDPCTTPTNVSRQTSFSNEFCQLDLDQPAAPQPSSQPDRPNSREPPPEAKQPPKTVKSRKARMAALKKTKAAQLRLYTAAKVGSHDAVQRAIAAGADVNLADTREAGEHEHVPALVMAACGCHADVIEMLVDAGAELESCNPHGVTALMEAASSERKKAVEATEKLIALKANLDAVDCDGESALFKAAEAGCIKPVKVLINRGADPTLKDSRGRDAADVAESGAHSKIAQLLRLVSQKYEK